MPRQPGILATDGQGKEVTRQARAVGITAKVFQERGLQGPDAVIPIALEAIRRGCTISIDEFVPTFDPATGTFRWQVNYDETTAAKIAVKDTKSLAWATDHATDEKFPDDRKGKRVVMGRIWFPNCYMKQDALEHEAPGILARPKELIDFSKTFPRPTLDNDMPLAGPGQFWADADDNRYYLYLDRLGVGRSLSKIGLGPRGEWFDSWRFLVLDS